MEFSKKYTSKTAAEAGKIQIGDDAFAIGEAIQELIHVIKKGGINGFSFNR